MKFVMKVLTVFFTVHYIHWGVIWDYVCTGFFYAVVYSLPFLLIYAMYLRVCDVKEWFGKQIREGVKEAYRK